MSTPPQGKVGKGLVRRYVEKVTGLSRAQVTRLIAGYVATGRVKATDYRRPRFSSRYTKADLDLLSYLDKAHGNLSGPATRRIPAGECGLHGIAAYERLLRRSPSSTTSTGTRASIPIAPAHCRNRATWATARSNAYRSRATPYELQHGVPNFERDLRQGFSAADLQKRAATQSDTEAALAMQPAERELFRCPGRRTA